jgi:hypothetical protein
MEDMITWNFELVWNGMGSGGLSDLRFVANKRDIGLYSEGSHKVTMKLELS